MNEQNEEQRGCGSCDLDRLEERGEQFGSLCSQCQRWLNDNSDEPCNG